MERRLRPRGFLPLAAGQGPGGHSFNYSPMQQLVQETNLRPRRLVRRPQLAARVRRVILGGGWEVASILHHCAVAGPARYKRRPALGVGSTRPVPPPPVSASRWASPAASLAAALSPVAS